MPEFRIGERLVGSEHPPLVVAEIGINHGGSVEVALELVEVALDHGAEAIKLQTHVLEDEMSSEAMYRIPGNAEISIYEIIKSCQLSESEEEQVSDLVRTRDALFLSTPFSRKATDRIVRLDVDAIKIGSGECSNYPLVQYIANQGRPVIMSTGMHTLDQISRSVDILQRAGVPFALLHTTNVYPTPDSAVRLNAMQELASAFPDTVIGLSDHSETIYPCLGAVALGASILERHFTDTRERLGPDISASMNPEELSALIEGSRRVHTALGSGKGPVAEEAPTMSFALASVVATRDIHEGEILSSENLWVMRPAGGAFAASEFEGLLGRRCQHFVSAGRQLPATAVEDE